MHSEVTSGRPALLSIESSEARSDAVVVLNVNPDSGGVGALKGPQHAARESNRRACSRALKPRLAAAAVSGEG